MKKIDLELYPDDLLSTFGAATATSLSAMVDGEVKHDRVSRFLAQRDYTSKHFWRQVKCTDKQVENADGVLIFDDTIQEKAWTDESDLMCWHDDHCKGHAIPVAFEVAVKPHPYWNLKTRQIKRRSEKTKNELMRTQSSPIFMSIYATFKLECLSLKTQLNPTALRAKLLTHATRSAFENLRQQQAPPAAA